MTIDLNKYVEFVNTTTSKPSKEHTPFIDRLMELRQQEFPTERLGLAEVGKFISPYFSEVKKKAVRWVMLNERKRLDGRNFDEIRPIWAEVDYLPMVHGSAVFTRGE